LEVCVQNLKIQTPGRVEGLRAESENQDSRKGLKVCVQNLKIKAPGRFIGLRAESENPGSR
jgi:hypothetical protein